MELGIPNFPHSLKPKVRYLTLDVGPTISISALKLGMDGQARCVPNFRHLPNFRNSLKNRPKQEWIFRKSYLHPNSLSYLKSTNRPQVFKIGN